MGCDKYAEKMHGFAGRMLLSRLTGSISLTEKGRLRVPLL